MLTARLAFFISTLPTVTEGSISTFLSKDFSKIHYFYFKESDGKTKRSSTRTHIKSEALRFIKDFHLTPTEESPNPTPIDHMRFVLSDLGLTNMQSQRSRNEIIWNIFERLYLRKQIIKYRHDFVFVSRRMHIYP